MSYAISLTLPNPAEDPNKMTPEVLSCCGFLLGWLPAADDADAELSERAAPRRGVRSAAR